MVCSRLRCFMRSPPPLPITNLSLVGLSFARAHVQTQVFCTVPSTGLPLLVYSFFNALPFFWLFCHPPLEVEKSEPQ